MVTMKRVPDIFEQKNGLIKGETRKQKADGYQDPSLHSFKNYDTLAFGQRDFDLNKNVPQIENPNFLSEHDKLPKEFAERQR